MFIPSYFLKFLCRTSLVHYILLHLLPHFHTFSDSGDLLGHLVGAAVGEEIIKLLLFGRRAACGDEVGHGLALVPAHHAVRGDKGVLAKPAGGEPVAGEAV